MDWNDIKSCIEQIYSSKEGFSSGINDILQAFVTGLNNGQIRAAELIDGTWHTNQWVKQGILLLFRLGQLSEMEYGNNTFFDKSTLKLRKFSIEDNVRLVPGGSFVRNGSFVSSGVICMSPSYINIGAYIDAGTMVDSHALVGTCAQIGKQVHISAATQIGGVLEPIGASPVIIEDNVMLGGNCGIYEGVIIKKNAILGSGVILNSSTKVYDLINETVIESSPDIPLTIPEDAVVVPGSRSVNTNWGMQNKLSISTPIIVKYRDNKSNSKTELETILRK